MPTAAFLGLTSLFGLIYLAYGVRTADAVTIAISTLILVACLVAAVLRFRLAAEVKDRDRGTPPAVHQGGWLRSGTLGAIAVAEVVGSTAPIRTCRKQCASHPLGRPLVAHRTGPSLPQLFTAIAGLRCSSVRSSKFFQARQISSRYSQQNDS